MQKIQNTWFYNLMAILAERVNRFKDITDPDLIEDEELIESQINEMLDTVQININAPPDAFPDISRASSAIIQWCDERNDYYVYRATLCRLDTMINMNALINALDFNSNPYAPKRTFTALNNNFEATGFKILPYVDSVKAYNPFNTDQPRENAHTFINDINKRMHNVYIVCMDELMGCSDIHVTCVVPENITHKDHIRIAVSPLTCVPYNNLIDFSCYSACCPESTRSAKYFSVTSIMQPEEIVDHFCNNYNIACKEGCDIFIAPEMLGVEELIRTNANGVNLHYSPNQLNDFKTPVLTLAPTFWAGNSNKLHIFSQTGELIGVQYKQYSFIYTDLNNVSWKEHLINTCREILVIHIPGWGRFSFPICKDYLITDYRKVLVDSLKVNFLLCPAFSFGQYNFDISIHAAAEFETRTVYVNSCSALSEAKRNRDGIGLISTPIVSEDRIQKITPQCDGRCGEKCVFIVDIPINKSNQKNGATIKHIW